MRELLLDKDGVAVKHDRYMQPRAFVRHMGRSPRPGRCCAARSWSGDRLRALIEALALGNQPAVATRWKGCSARGHAVAGRATRREALANLRLPDRLQTGHRARVNADVKGNACSEAAGGEVCREGDGAHHGAAEQGGERCFRLYVLHADCTVRTNQEGQAELGKGRLVAVDWQYLGVVAAGRRGCIVWSCDRCARQGSGPLSVC